MDRLAGKVALITGAGRGVGRALALKLVREGASVVINDVDSGPIDEVLEMIAAFGGRATPCVGDVTDPAFGKHFVQTALDTFAGLDIIVTNAGYDRRASANETNDDLISEMIDVNLIAHLRIIRAAAEPMQAMARTEREQGREVIRKLVLVSSMSGTHGLPGHLAYSAAKAGLTGVTKTLSKEWGPHKVCVNCVAFGFIETRLTVDSNRPDATIEIAGKPLHAGVPADVLATVPQLVPLGRAGTPEEAAGAITLLCLPESDYVSGQVLVVGGGLSL